MIIENKIIDLIEEFKIPYNNPFCPEDWKDWYHYILFDPKTKIRILFNLCFNGKPSTGFVTDTFIITTPKGFLTNRILVPTSEESYGFARNHSWIIGDLKSNPLSFHNSQIDFLLNQNKLSLSIKNADLGLEFHLKGLPYCNPIYVPEAMPYGKGFIGWGVMPRYKLSGEIKLNDRYISITNDWYGYHDRNFGRFNWGNIGWTWFIAYVTKGNDSWTYVLHQSNKNDFAKSGPPILIIHKNGLLQKIFLGDTIKINIEWSLTSTNPKILPGSMASVYANRSIKKPLKMIILAKDERDQVLIELFTDSFVEIIVPDSETRNYTYLKELSGTVEITQYYFNNKMLSNDGFFYSEIVH